MTIRASLPRALSRIAITVALMATIGLVWTRWQEHRWPDTYFYVSFAVAFALIAAGSYLVIIPWSITLTEGSLSIDWPFRRAVTVPVDELEAYMQGRLFMIQLERHPTQLIFESAFARGDWGAFVGELEPVPGAKSIVLYRVVTLRSTQARRLNYAVAQFQS